MEQHGTKKISYKKLFINEKGKREKIESDLQEKNKLIEKLQSLLLTKSTELEEAKKELLSHTNSKTAKDGYKEEQLICDDLRDTQIQNKFSPILGNDYDECVRIHGNHKCDIQSKNKKLSAQVKKFQKGQFQQLDRHWVIDIVKNIPGLSSVSEIIKDLFEYPLLPNQTHVDKEKSIKTLSVTNYSQEKIDNFLSVLNQHKRHLLHYAFLGTNVEKKPDYLFGVEYVNKKRDTLFLFEIEKIMDYLLTLDFRVSPRKTVIWLGDEAIVSLQRKGGDSGRKSSNQVQIKVILSKLLDKVDNVKHKLKPKISYQILS